MARKAAEIETKSENKQAVYRYIQEKGSATRQELYSGLGLSLPTIKQSLEFLERSELIVPADIIRNTGGRNATAYRIREDGRFAAGVFLSTNHITAVCVDLTGSICSKKRIRITLDLHQDSYLRAIGELVTDTIADARIEENRITGVGIAVPSLVSEDGESILFGMTHDFSGITRAVLSKYISLPTRLFHDSFVAGFAEVWSTPAIRNAFYLSLNNSIGGAVIIDNKIYTGNHQRAGEVGHILIDPVHGKRCYCGQTGCLDTVCNAGLLDSLTDGSLEDFFTLLRSGNDTARSRFDVYLDHLTVAIHNLHMLYDCEIILGGYVGAFMDEYMDELCRKVDAYAIFQSYARSYVLPCRYKTESTAAGAAIQMIEHFIAKL